jgi:flagellar hook-associated protein 2
MADIISALNAGSGVNIKELTTSLVAAAREPQQKQITARKTEAETKISSVASILSTISSYNSALSSIGNTKLFQRLPISSDATKVSVEFKDGTAPPAFSGQVAVEQMATQSALRFGPITSLDQNIAGGTLKITNDANITRTFGALSSLDLEVTSQNLTAAALGWDPTYAASGATTTAYAGLASFFANGGLMKITTGADGRPTEVALSDGSATPLTLKIDDPLSYAPIEDTGVPQQGTLTIGGVKTGADELSFVFGGTLAPLTTGLTASDKTTLVGSLVQTLSTRINVGTVNNPDFESGAAIKLATRDAEPVGSEVASLDLSQYKTLTSLRDKISSIEGLDANIVQGTINGATGYYLVVKGATGSTNRMMASVSGFTPFQMDTSVGSVSKGQDALITVDGISMTSASNSFDDIIPGVRFTALVKTNVGETVSVRSKTDTDALSNAMSVLVAGFNVLQQAIAEQTKFDIDNTKKGGLAGSTAARGVLAELRRFTTQPLSGYGAGTYTLAEIGVRTNKDGSLTLDEKVFAKMLSEKPDVVEAILASKQSVSDSRISVSSLSDKVLPGRYVIAKKDLTTWTINGVDATVANNRLTGVEGTTLEGLKLTMPTVVLAAPVGYSTTFNYGIGLIDRLKTMLTNVEKTNSPLNLIVNTAKTAMTKLTLDEQKLDTRMKALEKRYMKQFIASENAAVSGKSTQTSLTQFMESWRASLKA